MVETSERTTSAPHYRGGEHGTPLSLRQGDVLAVIPLSDGQELRLVRMPDGLIGLGCFHTLPPDDNTVVIGSINDLAALATAMQAVARTLGPGHGCE